MDIASKKLPMILIIILGGILAVQLVANSSDTDRFVDEDTCEIYAVDSKVGGKQYLGDFDQACLDAMNP